MKWPDGTSDIVKPQSHTRVCQLYTRTHPAGRATAASDRQWGYLWTEEACVKMSKLRPNPLKRVQTKRNQVGFINRRLLVLLVVLGAPSLSHEAFGQLLQVPGVFHLDLWLLSEEILKVLQQLDPHVCLLVQTFLLLHQLGPDLWKDTRVQTDLSDAAPFGHMHWMVKASSSK